MKRTNFDNTNVFISYKTDVDSDLRAFLVKTLTSLSGVYVVYDRNIISPTRKIHREIYSALDKCNLIIVASSSFESKEVVCELVRAHERKKEIVVLSKEGNPSEIPPHLYFLSDRLQIQYRNFDDLENKPPRPEDVVLEG